ncbi:MAG: sigma-70 family RNA polymerase sigma factor [Planctomycetota bacterium]
MSDSPLRPENDAWLLEHAEWLRALCQRLVQGADAGDLAQDTLVAAIRNPPREGTRLRAWLTSVARNQARSARLRRLRREARERIGAKPEALPSPAEVTENLNVQRLVVEAVSALDEPYRSTLVHRYYEGLSCSEIARRQGLPAPTVRSRLQRAHALVRRSLQLELGDSRWALAVSPLAFPRTGRRVAAAHASSSTTTSAAGALAMKKVIVLAAALLTMVAGGWWISRPVDATPPEARPLEVARPEVESAALLPASIPDRAADRVAVVTPSGAPGSLEVAAAASGTLEIAVEPASSAGRALLRLSPSGGIFDWWSSPTVERELVGGKATFSGLPFDHFALVEVHLDDQTVGLPWTHECSGPTVADPNVVVRRAMPGALPVITGRLVDGAGTPQRRATLLARLGFPRAMPEQFSKAWDGGQQDRTILTDDDGRFAYPVEHRFMAGTRRELLLRPMAGGEPASLGGTATIDLSRVLEPGVHEMGDVALRTTGRITGLVRDDAGGGVPRARISVWKRPDDDGVEPPTAPTAPSLGGRGWTHAADLRTTTDDDGRFVVGSPDDRFAVLRLRVEAEGYAPLESEDVSPGTAGLELFLQRGRSVHGRVLVDEGVSLEDVGLRVVEGGGRSHFLQVDADGTFRCSEIGTDPVQLFTHLDDERLDAREVTPSPDEGAGSAVLIDLRGLVRVWSLRFLVEEDEPVARPDGGDLWLNLSDAEGRRPYWLLQKKLDDEGRCSFALRGAVETVRATLPGHRAVELTYSSEEQEIRLAPPIPVKLTIPNELPTVQAPLSLMVDLAPLNQNGAPQWNDAVVVKVDAGGTALARMARPGTYRVRFVVWERFEGRSAIHSLPELDPMTITVDNSSGEQQYDLVIPECALDALRERVGQD